MNPRICLVIERVDGRQSEAQIEGSKITSDMLDAAEDLLHTLTTGERPVVQNLYDLVARAFGTTREKAKKRIIAAAYGMPAQMIESCLRISEIDRRRLADGDRALALPEPLSPNEVENQLTVVLDGIRALQSLDDIGVEENRQAAEKLRTLEQRYADLKARLPKETA